MNDFVMVLGAVALPIAMLATSLLPMATLRWSQRDRFKKYKGIERK